MSSVSRLIEELQRNEYEDYIRSQSECDFCRYEFNKQYESKCPLCGIEVKSK